jgi:hemolysin activation/secretion protein
MFTGGNNSWSLGLTSGTVVNEVNVNKGSDSFTKGNVGFSRLQSLGSKNGLYLAFGGQWANSNLDASQKLTIGGSNSVRSYAAGAVSGDLGYSLSAEYRHDLDSLWNGQLQAVAFIDGAHVTQQKDPGVNAANNEVSLSGIGLGLNWSGPQQWNAKTYLATPLKTSPAQLGEVNSLRAWLEVSRGF